MYPVIFQPMVSIFTELCTELGWKWEWKFNTSHHWRLSGLFLTLLMAQWILKNGMASSAGYQHQLFGFLKGIDLHKSWSGSDWLVSSPVRQFYIRHLTTQVDISHIYDLLLLQLLGYIFEYISCINSWTHWGYEPVKQISLILTGSMIDI